MHSIKCQVVCIIVQILLTIGDWMTWELPTLYSWGNIWISIGEANLWSPAYAKPEGIFASGVELLYLAVTPVYRMFACVFAGYGQHSWSAGHPANGHRWIPSPSQTRRTTNLNCKLCHQLNKSRRKKRISVFVLVFPELWPDISCTFWRLFLETNTCSYVAVKRLYKSHFPRDLSNLGWWLSDCWTQAWSVCWTKTMSIESCLLGNFAQGARLTWNGPGGQTQSWFLLTSRLSS